MTIRWRPCAPPSAQGITRRRMDTAIWIRSIVDTLNVLSRHLTESTRSTLRIVAVTTQASIKIGMMKMNVRLVTCNPIESSEDWSTSRAYINERAIEEHEMKNRRAA